MDTENEPPTTYADRLRTIADIIETTPEFASAASTHSLPTVTVHAFEPATFRRLAALLPGTVEYTAKEQYKLYYASSEGIQIVGGLDSLCEHIQVGVTPVYEWTLKPAAEPELAAAS